MTLSCAIGGSRMWLSVFLLPVTAAWLHKATCPGFLGVPPVRLVNSWPVLFKNTDVASAAVDFLPLCPPFCHPSSHLPLSPSLFRCSCCVSHSKKLPLGQPESTLTAPVWCRCAGGRLRVVATATRRSNLLNMKGRNRKRKAIHPLLLHPWVLKKDTGSKHSWESPRHRPGNSPREPARPVAREQALQAHFSSSSCYSTGSPHGLSHGIPSWPPCPAPSARGSPTHRRE